ncbi:Protein of unknown function [Pyronema omphalodes CBS 100304]|uniref:Uncharacterized protein n=1 Tax=Pyronema omphalodes (strain CBS 100304) TaxID=1076935 RepID=U4LQE9_PYROM|nr:Protein of unknown function [Pyronema omphalodes CBS 100304]
MGDGETERDGHRKSRSRDDGEEEDYVSSFGSTVG